MNVRSIRRRLRVILRSGAHHNGQNVAVQRVDKQLFGNVVAAVGVLEGQIEFVVVVEDVETFAGRAARAFVRAARSVDVHLIRKRIIKFLMVALGTNVPPT